MYSVELAPDLSRSFNAVELFAGAGGLALGLGMSGLVIKALVDVDPYCCMTLQHNASRYFPHASVIQSDLRRLPPQRLLRIASRGRDPIHVVSGGPPCQSFSISRIPKGGRFPEDPRDSLLDDYVHVVKVIRPTLFLFENVQGLLSKSNGKIFNRLLMSFQALGYSTLHKVLNSADYGVPQHRRRLFIIGSRLGTTDLEFPEPTHGPKNNHQRLHSYVSIRRSISRLGRKLENQRIPKTTIEKKQKLAAMPPGSEWKHWRHRDLWDSPSRCITAHCKDDWVHPLEARHASVRELACLQTFPRDYVFRGPFSGSNDANFQFQYRQVGNSVPILMAKAIGDSLVKHLSGRSSESC